MHTIVIDANVFKAFYEVEVLGYPPPRPQRTGDAKPIFDSLGSLCVALLDSGGQIEIEWRNMCLGGEEWFNEWMATAYANGQIFPIDVPNTAAIKKKYQKLGFPVNLRDFWYIKLCLAILNMCNKHEVVLVTEDIEFYSPQHKNHTGKNHYIVNSKGTIAKELRDDGVRVCCISNSLLIL